LANVNNEVFDPVDPPPYQTAGATMFHRQKLNSDDSGFMLGINEEDDEDIDYVKAKTMDVRPKVKRIQETI
jgi:hypothetical protein